MKEDNEDKFYELTKEFIQRKNKHTKKHWFGKTGVVQSYKFWSPKKRDDGADSLLLQDMNYSKTSQTWLISEISENEFSKDDLMDWKQRLKSHRFKRADRLHFLVIYAAIFTSVIVLAKSNFLPELAILISVIFAIPVLNERQENTNIMSALEELEELIQKEADRISP